MAGGVVLATYLHPDLSEAEVHSWMIRASGRCGRPATIDHELMVSIFRLLGGTNLGGQDPRQKFERPYSYVAGKLGISVSIVSRAVKEGQKGD
jgi:hypothetical protein